MSRPDSMRLAVRGALTLALLASAASVMAQTGPLPAPPPIAVSQSEPGYGPLAEQRSALVTRQTAINQHRTDHNAVCLGIPASNTSQIAWCRADVDAIGRDKAAYGAQLRTYNANQFYYQGHTRYLRKDYAGAIPFYEQSISQAVRIDGLLTELLLAKARLAEQNGDMEKARALMCEVNSYEASRPSWLSTELNQLFGRLVGWMKRYSKKFEVRTPTCVIAVRG